MQTLWVLCMEASLGHGMESKLFQRDGSMDCRQRVQLMELLMEWLGWLRREDTMERDDKGHWHEPIDSIPDPYQVSTRGVNGDEI